MGPILATIINLLLSLGGFTEVTKKDWHSDLAKLFMILTSFKPITTPQSNPQQKSEPVIEYGPWPAPSAPENPKSPLENAATKMTRPEWKQSLRKENEQEQEQENTYSSPTPFQTTPTPKPY